MGDREMKLASVNIGTVQPIAHAKPSGKTGIFKNPVADPVRITRLGPEGDSIVDTVNHGGVEQAVYVFTIPDYEWWANHIKRPLAPGTFGENLTLSEMESGQLHIGDRFRAGPVLLEIASPRVPCVTLAARMGDPQFVRIFRNAERPGAYCRVIEEGVVRAGNPVEYIPFDGPQVSLVEVFRIFHHRQLTASERERMLSVPIDRKFRDALLRIGNS
jgi:MOSC domain-containing protein YiiM